MPKMTRSNSRRKPNPPKSKRPTKNQLSKIMKRAAALRENGRTQGAALGQAWREFRNDKL